MKATLTKMDYESLHFLCTDDGTYSTVDGTTLTPRSIVRLSIRPGHSPHVYSFQVGANVVWAEVNANPHKQHMNTTTLAAVRQSETYEQALSAVRRRMVELEEQYTFDHSMFAARQEVHASKLHEALDELCKAVLKDGGHRIDADGSIASAAHAYCRALALDPSPPENPWAFNARERRAELERGSE